MGCLSVKKKILLATTPIGLILYLIYILWTRFIGEIPDMIAYPIMIVSIILMVIGIAYHGYCLGTGNNPYVNKR